MAEALIFKSCTGLYDGKVVASQAANLETGATCLTAVSNMTITDDGCIQTAPDPTLVLSHSLPVTRVSAGQRIFFSDDIDTYELVANSPVKRFPLVSGPMMHTPLDVRVSTASRVYKSVNPAGVMAEAAIGTNPDPADSVPYDKQPVFDGGFVLGARAFCHKGKFLQYSKGYHYDLWNLGDGFIGHQFDCLQSGAIAGCTLVAHPEGVSVYVGGDPLQADSLKKFYPCAYEDGSLFSGFISKVMGYGHVFLCADGVYMVGQDGAINRLSSENLNYADSLNSSYAGAVVAGGKYLAFGDQVAVEFDFGTKAVMKRASGAASACVFADTAYIASGSSVSTLQQASVGSAASSFTLPYSALGSAGKKSFDSLYITGDIIGDLDITLLDQISPEEPERWTITASFEGAIQNRRVKLPKGKVGSKTAFRFDMQQGGMRIEEIRVTFGAEQRR